MITEHKFNFTFAIPQ